MNITVARTILKTYDLDLDFVEGAGKSGTTVNKRVQAVNPTTQQRIDLMSYTMFQHLSYKAFYAIVAREVAGAK